MLYALKPDEKCALVTGELASGTKPSTHFRALKLNQVCTDDAFLRDLLIFKLPPAIRPLARTGIYLPEYEFLRHLDSLLASHEESTSVLAVTNASSDNARSTGDSRKGASPSSNRRSRNIRNLQTKLV